MEYTSIQKNVGDSPRKLRLIADMIRKMSPTQAVEILPFTNKAAATTLYKAIKTALANTGGREDLNFKKIEINEGMKMRRYHPGTAGRGRGRPYSKKLSHIKIVLTDEVVVKEIKQNKKTTQVKKEKEVVDKLEVAAK